MRYLLALFFFVMYAGDALGLNVGLAPGISVKNMLLYIALVGIALNAAVARNRSLDLQSVLIPFALLVVYAVITWVAAAFVLKYSDYSLRQSFISLKSSLVDQFITLLVFLFGTMNLKDARWLLKTIIWIAIVGNVVTLIDTFNVPNLGLLDARIRDGRFEGFIGSANGYGQFLVLFFPLSVAIYLDSTGKVRKFAAVGVFSTLFALVLTGSRGAYVGLLVGGILAGFYMRHLFSTQMLVRMGVGAVGLIAFAIGISLVIGNAEIFLDRFSRFDGSAHLATSGRSTIWLTALKSMMEHPVSFITGFGFDAYTNSRSFYAATHNMYLTYLYDLGLIGVGLYLLIFSRILAVTRNAVQCAKEDSRVYLIALVFGIFGFLISIFFSEYHASAYLLWACMGVSLRVALDQPRTGHVDVRDSTPVLRPYA